MYRAAFIALTLTACASWPETQVIETKRRGDIIARAIAEYHAKKGKYPLALQDLQPRFIRDFPQPTVGYKHWHYELVDNGKDYWLQVVADEFGSQLDRSSAGWSYYPR